MSSTEFPPLDQIDVATPCQVPWEEMQGDDQVRRCAECKLNVYDLSSLDRAEAEQLVFENEGRVCVRFYRRHDGTVLTKDCPVGLRMLRRRLARSIAGIAALTGFLTCGAVFGRNLSTAPGRPAVSGPLSRLIEWIAPTDITVMGLVCPTPTPAPRPPVTKSGNAGEL